MEFIIGLIGLIVGAAGAALLLKLLGAQTLDQARKQADEMLARAKAEGQTQAKQIELDARNEQAKRREEFDKETDAARSEMKEMERRMILSTLSRFRENRTQAARHLGISVRTLRNKLNLYRQKGQTTTA